MRNSKPVSGNDHERGGIESLHLQMDDDIAYEIALDAIGSRIAEITSIRNIPLPGQATQEDIERIRKLTDLRRSLHPDKREVVDAVLTLNSAIKPSLGY